MATSGSGGKNDSTAASRWAPAGPDPQPGQQASQNSQLPQLVEPCPVHHAFILSRFAHSMQLVYPNSMTGL